MITGVHCCTMNAILYNNSMITGAHCHTINIILFCNIMIAGMHCHTMKNDPIIKGTYYL